MSEEVNLDNAVTEVNQGVVQEIHAIEDLAAASDFELKHSPNVIVEELGSGKLVKVSIGLNDISHPQTEEHFIEWIRLFDGSEPVGEVAFGPSDTPQAEFTITHSSGQIIAQALCNLHGIWETRV